MVNIRIFSFLTIFCFLQFFFISVVFSSDVSLISKRCISCHGVNGNSSIEIWPKIAGQHAEYIFSQLIEFKKGKDGLRFDPNMFSMLQGLNEDDLLDLSKYYSNQIIEKSSLKVNNDSFLRGKSIYLYGNDGFPACFSCHGIDGSGNRLAKYPSLKWQHKEYLLTQLKKFKSLERSNDINGIMRDISLRMTELEMQDVSIYISNMN